MANTVSFILNIIDKMTSPVQKVGKVVDKVFGSMDKRIDATTKATGGLGMTIDNLRRKIDMIKASKNSFVNIADFKMANAELRKMESHLRRMEGMSAGGGFLRGFSGIGSMIRRTVMPALFAVSGAFGVSEMLTQTKEFEQTGALFATKFGDQATQKLGMVQKAATETPFEFKEIATITGKLKGRGFATDEKALMRNSDLAVGLGGSYEQLGEAIMDLPLGQTRRLEELGVGVTAIKGTDKLRITYGGLTQDVEKNTVAVEKAMDNLSKLPGIAGSSAAQMETLGGKFSNLGDMMQLGFATAGEALRPFIMFVVDGLTSVIVGLTGFFDWIMKNQHMVIDLVKVFSYAIVGLAVAYAWYEKAAIMAWIAQMKLNLAFLASPIGLVVLAIAVLAAGFVYLWNKSEGFRGAIMGIWESFKQLASNILNIFMPVITNLMSAFTALSEGRWADAAAFGVKAMALAVSTPFRAVGALVSGDVFEGVGSAYNKGNAQGRKDFQNEKKADGRSLLDRLTNPNGKQLANMGGDGSASKLNGDAAGANGSGSDKSKAPRITTINFGPQTYQIKAIAKGGDMASMKQLADEISGYIAAGLYDVDVQMDAQ